MSIGEFIHARRIALKLEPAAIAAGTGINVPSYYDLEDHDDELSMCLSLAQIGRLQDVLSFDVRELFGDWAHTPEVSLQELMARIRQHLETEGQTIEDFEQAVGWRVKAALARPL